MFFDEIGKKIRLTRKNQHISQANLGNMLGMSRATISGIENGTITEIGIRKIMAICNILGLELLIQEKPSRPTLQQLIEEQENA